MAGEVFKVTLQELEATGNTFKNSKQNMQIAYLQMSNAIRTVVSSWKGDASDAFQNQFNALYKSLESTEQGIENTIKGMAQAAELFFGTEKELEGSFQALDTGTSPFDT